MRASASSILKRSFWISLLTMAVFMGALWFGGRAWLAQSVMPYDGRAVLDGLDARVEVLFDARGIPRIYAETDADAMRALGWLHAGERLFQMELIRRLARGELAELVGEAALEIDAMHRAMGFARRVAGDPPALDTETQTLIEAYTAGINAQVQSAERLPPGFVLLGAQPEPWTADDVLTIAYYQTYYPTTLVQRLSEAWYAATEAFGAETGRWLASLPEWTRSTIPRRQITQASNTWVVAPERSHSGAALHASDPHLDIDTAPGLWYAVGLHSTESLDVLGVTAPGLPFVAMGHNGQIAWAFTVAPVDVFELYTQPRHPEDIKQVRGPEGWQALTSRTETFRVRGMDSPVKREFHYTPLGRVIEMDEEQVLVMRWAGFELSLGELVASGLALNRARDFSSFRRAVSDMGALSVNWSYSDRAGNIGYVQSTPIPVRRHERFFSVLDGSDPQHDWNGFHPPDARPWALNPEQGWLANSNNHAAGEDWPYPIPGYYKHLRMRRISELLEQNRNFDRADMIDFQLSRLSDRALSWKDWLADIAESSDRTAIADELRAWDGVMAADSDMAGLFALWWQFLPRALFQDLEAPDWKTMRPLLDNWMHADPSEAPLSTIDRDAAALTALEDALKAGIHPLGGVQHLTIGHALARNKLLDHWLDLSRGPIPVGGDAGSLNVSYVAFDESSGRNRVRAGASMRFVMDWSDPDAFTLNLTLGQSGNPFSPHFDDFLGDFLDGEPWRVPWSREIVEQRAASRVILSD